jgi:hypothetical protein
MKNLFFFLLACVFLHNAKGQNRIPSVEEQIIASLQAAPENKRAQATVLGYDENGELITLKKGSNELICLADNPSDKTFSTACYHKDLEPFMARGRALKKIGKTTQERFDIRESEAKSGLLKMPNHPSTLYLLYGKDAQYDAKQEKVMNTHYRWVVYIPWATPESTGLPTSPMVPGGPWIMDPGTHKAHIMITPRWSEKDE